MNHVTICSTRRSGGTLLESKLGLYSDVKRLGEIFKKKKHPIQNDNIWPEESYLKKVHISKLKNESYNLYGDEFNHIIYRFHPKDYNYYEDTRAVFKFLNSMNNLILLYRENVLNQTVSDLIALKNRKWHYEEFESKPKYSDYQFHIGEDFLYNKVIKFTNFYNEILNIVDTDKVSVYIIKYEDLINNFDYDTLATKLDIKPNKSNEKIYSIHINSNDDGYKRVINYNEVGNIRMEFDSDTKRFKELLK